MNYTNVTNPIWAGAEHYTIDCEVTFDEIGTVPFTANPLDTSNPLSKQIFDQCVAGDYGVVAEYVASIIPDVIEPPQPTVLELQAQLAVISAQLQSLQGV
jgi:hypothetical protein